MKKKEDVGDGDQPIPADVVDKLGECTAEQLEVGTSFLCLFVLFSAFFRPLKFKKFFFDFRS